MGSLIIAAALAAQAASSGAKAPPAAIVPPPLVSIRLIAPGHTSPPENPAQLTNLVGMFSQDDYPAEALRTEAEGKALVELGVDAKGQVTSCTVLESSKSAALDMATCRVLTARALFKPATDKTGRPVADRFVQAVAWRLPEIVPREFTDRLASLVLTFDASGKLSSCTQDPPMAPAMAEERCANEGRLAANLVPLAERARRTMVMTSGFLTGGADAAGAMGRGTGETLVRRGVAMLTIAADGSVIDCEVGEGRPPWEDARDNRLCQQIRSRPFTPLANGDGRVRSGADVMVITLRAGKGS